MNEKLSDKITWEPDALKFIDAVLSRMRQEICEDAKKLCFQNDAPRINKAIAIQVIRNLRQICYFMDVDD